MAAILKIQDCRCIYIWQIRNIGFPIAHLPNSQARCSRGLRPSLAESVLSSTYWGREDELDIDYSLIFQQNANLMLAHCLRRWLNINPTLTHVTSRVWWDVVGAVCDTSCEILGHQTCAAYCRAGVVYSGPALKQHSCQRSNLGQTEKIFLESPHSNR